MEQILDMLFCLHKGQLTIRSSSAAFYCSCELLFLHIYSQSVAGIGCGVEDAVLCRESFCSQSYDGK